MSSPLENRYGSRPQRSARSSRFWVMVATLASMVAIAFMAWVQMGQQSLKPEFKDISHRLTSSDEVQLTFEVVKAPDTTAICAIKALNSNRAPVGWKEVEIGPNTAEQGDTRVIQSTEKVRVLGEATTVTVDDCWIEPSDS